MTDLSDAAVALLGSLWINPRFSLRYRMVENIPSDAAEVALNELCRAGILAREIESGGAVNFVLTDLGARMDRKPKGGMAFIEKHGSFPLSKPKSTP